VAFFSALWGHVLDVAVVLSWNSMSKSYLLINQTGRVVSTHLFIKKSARENENICKKG